MIQKIIDHISFVLIITVSAVFAVCPDETQVCLSLASGDLNYESTEAIAGFQFNHDGCVTGAGGGDAAAVGFTISSSSSTVLAFSFTGSTIAAGSGILVELDGDVTEDCLLEPFIFSDPNSSCSYF